MDLYHGHVRPATHLPNTHVAPGQIESDWPTADCCMPSPSLCLCHLCSVVSPSSYSGVSSINRPSQSRRLRYRMDDAPLTWELSHDQRSPLGTASHRGLPPTPPSSQGTQRSSKSSQKIVSTHLQGQMPRFNRQAGPIMAHRSPSSSEMVIEAGSWCADLSERRQGMVDDFLLYDDDDLSTRPLMPRCPSPPGMRLATPDLAPLCTDFEFCSCCSYGRATCSVADSRRREKLDAQVEDAMSYIAGVRSQHRRRSEVRLF